MTRKVALSRAKRRILTRLVEGWQLVGNFLVDPASKGRYKTREAAPPRAVQSLVRHGYVKPVEHPFVPCYELSDAGHAILLAYEGDDR
jgi:hypothetical protein